MHALLQQLLYRRIPIQLRSLGQPRFNRPIAWLGSDGLQIGRTEGLSGLMQMTFAGRWSQDYQIDDMARLRSAAWLAWLWAMRWSIATRHSGNWSSRPRNCSLDRLSSRLGVTVRMVALRG